MVVAGKAPRYTAFVGLSSLQSVPNLDVELSLWRQGYRFVAGVDEVGRGSWAGPVVAAAVVLPSDEQRLLHMLAGVRDSKQLTPDVREALEQTIIRVSLSTGYGWASHHTVDRLGIGAANRLAMRRAVAHLGVPADALVLDYFALPELDLPQVSLPKGDSRSLSIAAASIVAKVLRDRLMTFGHALYPQYAFHRNKGYGTAAHQEALRSYGVCRWHRKSFRPVAEVAG
jgi:ribonuclease HII